MYVPENWTLYEYSGIQMYISDAFGSSSSVNVVSQNETTNLKKAKKSEYQEMLSSAYGNIDIKTFTLVNFCGDTMLYIELSISQAGQTINMWQFMVSKDGSTRAVTITLLPSHSESIANAIYNSLVFN